MWLWLPKKLNKHAIFFLKLVGLVTAVHLFIFVSYALIMRPEKNIKVHVGAALFRPGTTLVIMPFVKHVSREQETKNKGARGGVLHERASGRAQLITAAQPTAAVKTFMPHAVAPSVVTRVKRPQLITTRQLARINKKEREKITEKVKKLTRKKRQAAHEAEAFRQTKVQQLAQAQEKFNALKGQETVKLTTVAQPVRAKPEEDLSKKLEKNFSLKVTRGPELPQLFSSRALEGKNLPESSEVKLSESVIDIPEGAVIVDNIQDVIAIQGNQDLDDVQCAQEVAQAVSSGWSPPAGLSLKNKLIVQVSTDDKGAVVQVNITQSSGVLAYDAYARLHVSRVIFPPSAHAKTFTLYF